MRERHQAIYKNDPVFVERVRVYSLEHYRNNRDKYRVRLASTHKHERELCFAHYGPHCACCNESRFEFLAIDHINGGGGKHRQEIGGKVSRWLVKNKFPPGFRVLCHNCNMALGMYGFCPHQLTKNI